MSLKSIKNKPHRDGFDLSRKFAFSAKLGELLPVFVEDVFPGDKFNISADWFTRSQPVTSPAFTRFGEYYDFFSSLIIFFGGTSHSSLSRQMMIIGLLVFSLTVLSLHNILIYLLMSCLILLSSLVITKRAEVL